MSKNKPVTCYWLSDASFRELSAICSSFISSNEALDMPTAHREFERIVQDMPKYPDQELLNLTTMQLDYLNLGSEDLNIPTNAALKLEKHATTEEKKKLSALLFIISWSIGCYIFTGYFKPFHKLTSRQRERALIGWKHSKFLTFRAMYQTFKKLTGLHFFSFNVRGTPNPGWKALEYDPRLTVSQLSKNPSPPQSFKAKFTLENLISKFPASRVSINGNIVELTIDVVIIGSGSGGGLMASELAKAGLQVLVLEKGGYYDSHDFRSWNETEAFDKMYDKGGLLSTSDGTIPILAGSCVGGGSTVNWSASFRTPEHVLRDWENMGLDIFKKGNEFEKHLDAVLGYLQVNCENSYRPRSLNEQSSKPFRVNLNNQLLYEAAERLGYHPEYIPRNVKNCVDCGHCGHGCPYDAKQSMLTALMHPLVDDGKLNVLANCFVQKIITKVVNGKKKAVGVECEVNDELGKKICQLVIKSNFVVCSAGSIQTPALLLRSKFAHSKIGRHLSLHPVIGVIGVFPGERTDVDKGVSMGVVVRDKGLSPNIEDRIAIETPPIHPGSMGLVMPWYRSVSYKLSSLLYKNVGAFINIHRDISSENNRVVIDSEGNPVVNYEVVKEDRDILARIIPKMYNLMYVAGATIMISSQDQLPMQYLEKNKLKENTLLSGSELEEAISRDDKYQRFLKQCVDTGIMAGNTGVFSAHQMGSCRMSAKPSEGPVSPTGELWECSNLYVSDGSLFPTSLGINPMITIAAFSRFVSREVMKAANVKPYSEDF